MWKFWKKEKRKIYLVAFHEQAWKKSQKGEAAAKATSLTLNRTAPTWDIEVKSTPEQAGQWVLQHGHKILQLLCHPYQKVVADQVVFGHFQCPGRSWHPAGKGGLVKDSFLRQREEKQT